MLASTPRAPNLSDSQPPGTWNIAYAQTKAEKMKPIVTLSKPNSLLISGAAVEIGDEVHDADDQQDVPAAAARAHRYGRGASCLFHVLRSPSFCSCARFRRSRVPHPALLSHHRQGAL